MSVYKFGSVVRVEATFKDPDDVLTNPTAVTLRVRDTIGAITTYAKIRLTNPSVGVWFKDLTLNQVGFWQFWFVGAGGVTIEDGGDMTTTAPFA